MSNKLFLSFMLLFATSALNAQEAQPQAVPEQGLWQTLSMIAIAILFFYVILWRPEQKRRKAMEAQRSAMKKGDRVTCMGVVGTIAKINENTILVKTGDNAKIEMLKAAISEVTPISEEDAKKLDKED